MIRKLLVLSSLFVVMLPTPTFAADVSKAEFATSYDVLYDVDEAGVTTITEKITLRNLTSEYFASQFKLTIGAAQIFDIKAQDPGGSLAVQSDQKDNATTISVNFNQQVAGMGKKLPWTISFKSKDFVQNLGKVWEVRVPRVAATTSLESYNLTLAVPQSFGEPTLISPTSKSQSTYSGKTFLTFDISQLKNTGVSASFGNYQLFDFDLAYHLENPNLIHVLTSIALPPDTAFQDVIYQRIEPKPLNVTLDNDGNYLAWFRLSRGQKLDIKAVGSVKLYTNSKVKNSLLDEILKVKYTSADKYWEKDNPQIIAKLNEILGKNPPTDTTEKARLIYQFVVDDLKYDSGRFKDNIERLGAVTVLNNPDSAVCMEFTDLFIALSRSANIPARELDGYAYSANTKLRPLSLTKDILHAWPEYFDEKKGWVMVDPTWQNTTGGVDYFNRLDLNHFVFAVKGSSSENPVTAGGYKYSGVDSRDVKVSLSNLDFLGHPQIDAQIDTTGLVFAGFPGKLRVKVINSGNSFYPSVLWSISTGELIIPNAGNQLGIVPSFGTSEFDVSFQTKSLFGNYNDQIVLLIGGQKFTKDITIKPFILFQTAPLIAEGIIALMVLIYLAVLGVHIYKKQKK